MVHLEKMATGYAFEDFSMFSLKEKRPAGRGKLPAFGLKPSSVIKISFLRRIAVTLFPRLSVPRLTGPRLSGRPYDAIYSTINRCALMFYGRTMASMAP